MSFFVDAHCTARPSFTLTLPVLKRLIHAGLWIFPAVTVSACDPTGPADGTVSQVIVTPEDPSVAYGKTLQLAAQAIGANGEPVAAAQVVWSMPDSATGRLDADGLFTALAPGSVVVTATVDGVSGSTDVTVMPLRFASVSARHRTTCGLTVDGEAYCWGDNELGQIGDGTQEPKDVPAAVAGGHTFSQVQAGSTSCGIVSGTPH